jgi:hypothetical protein
MIRRFSGFLALMLVVWLPACRRYADTPAGSIAEPGISDPYTVRFDISPLRNMNEGTAWLAKYASQGRVAKFRIEFAAAKDDSAGAPKTPQFKFGKGSIQSESGSDASVLLVDLKKALEAKTLPVKVQRSESLSFTYAVLGEYQSRRSDGGFTDKPSGHWTATKIFIPTGDEDVEVFFNFNPVIGKAEFSQKDSDYGDEVLAKLATVL